MKIKKLSSLVAILFIGQYSVGAINDQAIMKYSSCPDVKVIEPEESNGYFLSGDCKTVHIRPAKSHGLAINQFKYTKQNLNCDEFNAYVLERNEANQNKRKRVKRYEQKISELETTIDMGGTLNGMSVDQMEEQVSKHEDSIDKILDRNEKNLSLIKGEIVFEAKQEGAHAKFYLSDQQAELRNKFVELNKNSGLNFSNITTSFSTISYNSKNVSVTEQGERLGDILKIDIPTVNKIDENGKSVETNLGQGDLQGHIDFSKVGACALKNYGVRNNDTFSAEQIKGDIVVNRFNEYTVHLRGGFKVSYNYSEIIKEIHKQTKKRRLFKNKTKNSKLKFTSFEEIIKFESITEEKDIGLSVEELNDVRKSIIDRALKKIVTLKTGNPVVALKLLQPDANNGADIAANELSKCLHLYCQIGSAGLKVLSGIFGGSSTMTEFHSKFNAKIVEEAIFTLPISLYSSSSYK